MNFQLMEQIVRHIFANLGVMPVKNVDLTFNTLLRSEQYLLTDKLRFEGTDDEPEVVNSVWGCEITLQDHKMQILLGDCTQDSRVPEYCVVTQLQNSPAYGMYLVYNDLVEGCLSDPLIAVCTSDKNWMPCETYLQATYLAGMEQIRDLGFGWSKCKDHKKQFELMNAFIKYHSVFYGAV